ncbi:MAG: hypothetical protein H7332_02680 [Bdellovibrionales bacterium]|nr:hypothetical protein [Ramlibacter sp.]
MTEAASGVSVTPLFLSGAFAGITAMILLLSLLIGYAYRERMLWWHGATLGVQWLVWIYETQEPRAFSDAAYLQAAGLAALALAAMSIYLSMVWRSRLLSENDLRVQARDTVDPLTGFVMPRVFFTQAIASALRPHDTGARVSGNRFGVLAEGVSGRQGAIELATRILAHGMRGAEVGLPGSELKFHIAAIEISQLGTDVSVILKGLEDTLAQMAAQPASRPIRVLQQLEPTSYSPDGTLST